MTGEDRRQLYLHRDRRCSPGWPKELRGDGDSSPLLVDLEGDDRNDLIVATSDGWIHAYRPDGSEAPGWPVHTDPLPLHLGERAFGPGGVGRGHYGAVLGGRRPGTCRRRRDRRRRRRHGRERLRLGRPGPARLPREREPGLLGRAAGLTNPRWGGRAGARERTEGGFLSAPVLANLNGDGPARHCRRVRGPPPVRVAGRRRGRQGLPGGDRGPRQGQRRRPDEQPADVQRQRARQPGQIGRPGQDRRHPRRGATGWSPASRRASSSAPTRSTWPEHGQRRRTERQRRQHRFARRRSARRDC